MLPILLHIYVPKYKYMQKWWLIHFSIVVPMNMSFLFKNILLNQLKLRIMDGMKFQAWTLFYTLTLKS